MNTLLSALLALLCAALFLRAARPYTVRSRGRYLIALLLAFMLSMVVTATTSAEPMESGRRLVRLWFWFLLALLLLRWVWPNLRAQMGRAAAVPLESQADVGGIESITLDGERLYFGFSYSSDLVLSPPFRDGAQMAAWAAQHMAQRDGMHDAAYWQTLVDESVHESSLSDERDFSLAALRALPGVLRRIAESGKPDAQALLSYHLLYLLEATGSEPMGIAGVNTESISETIEARRLGFSADSPVGAGDIDGLLGVCRGDPAPAETADCADAARVVQDYLDLYVSHVPEEWREVFGALHGGASMA